jgi:hypothetical protein
VLQGLTTNGSATRLNDQRECYKANHCKSSLGNSGAGTITNLMNFYAQSPVNSGTVAGAYGLYIQDQDITSSVRQRLMDVDPRDVAQYFWPPPAE